MAQARGYIKFIKQLKEQISKSRYQAASLVNREVLLLYFNVGKMIHEKLEKNLWGAKVVEQISEDIQKDFPGIKGFSQRNLFSMQLLYKEYAPVILQTVSAELQERKKTKKKPKTQLLQTVSAVIKNKTFLDYFFKVSFTSHILILSKCKNLEERVFYTVHCAVNSWSFRKLEYHIESDLFSQKGKIQNNFSKTLPHKIAKQAVDSFKDEYLLNFINISAEDLESDLEGKIIDNIQKFLMSLGDEFTFVARQYKLLVSKKEYALDLLFFNRRLACLVAIDLKTTEFKPEHAGKMDFYLSAIDDKVKLPHENPTIGIILCKEKDETVVEYSLRNKNKSMGVSTYNFNQLPKKYKDSLPTPATILKIMNNNI